MNFAIIRRAAAVCLAAGLLISGSLAHAANYTDIWWNPAQSGWGVNLVQSDQFIFATFFIYGAAKQPTWVTANLVKDASGAFTGPVYLTTGTYYGSPWNPADVTAASVGTAAILRFLRPVCYQDFPDTLLPAALKHSNPLLLRRLFDGQREA